MPVPGRGALDVPDPAQLHAPFLVFLPGGQIKLPKIRLCLFHIFRPSVLWIGQGDEITRSSICKWDDNIPSVLKVYEVAKELNKPVEFFLEEDKEVKIE